MTVSIMIDYLYMVVLGNKLVDKKTLVIYYFIHQRKMLFPGSLPEKYELIIRIGLFPFNVLFVLSLI